MITGARTAHPWKDWEGQIIDGKVPLLYQLRGQTGRVIGDPFADLAQRKVSVSYNGGVPGFTLTFHLDLSCATMG